MTRQKPSKSIKTELHVLRTQEIFGEEIRKKQGPLQQKIEIFVSFLAVVLLLRTQDGKHY